MPELHCPRGHGVVAILVMAAGSRNPHDIRTVARTAVLSRREEDAAVALDGGALAQRQDDARLG